MWHFISDQISQKIHQDFICNDIREISEGDSHSAYRLCDGRRRFFTKVISEDKYEHFAAEIEGLEHLRQTNIFKIPEVICMGTQEGKCFLVLEFLSLSQGDDTAWFDFGSKLASLHQQHTQQMYGWQEDNFIGLTPQPNKWSKSWANFFAEQRIGFMLQMLAEKGQKLCDIDSAVESVNSLLAGHSPVSSMLHGDLWIGNTGFNKNLAVIFDPAFYYGDRETDIAMTELFTQFPTSFYRGYESVWPLPEHYQYRKSIYQLYHILNHAFLFGGQYLQRAQGTLKNLASMY
ncbi:fructosamine kinase family protein [Aliiglaciecola sp. LCG003]|uniref:fructosamine kinase family protein n=1 Tax=Aliiglaciecola sp. LCG003 TaxID=3053655 RepID=UPI00257398BE|nr:fructosamine kinase family protein [Aliiglaciecola sp. LCG003]WJG07971.1 fructosamine kinase family protein [Aliiglaciecola sp. LCG003]